MAAALGGLPVRRLTRRADVTLRAGYGRPHERRTWSTGTSRSRSGPGSPARAPTSSRAEAAEVVDASCAPAPTAPPGWCASSPGWSPASAPRPSWSSTAPGWVQANADGFATILAPVIDKLAAQQGPPHGAGRWRSAPGSPAPRSARCSASWPPRCSASSTRSSTRTAGCCWSPPTSSTSSASSACDPRDFRLWVCLHEETHRVQFTAVPWMRDHLFGEMQALGRHRRADPAARGRRSSGVTEVDPGGDGSLLDVMGTPEQKEILDRVTGVMSLLEGHADVVMDGVGPAVIPSVADDPRAVQPAPPGRRRARPAAAPAARPRRQDGAVPRRRRVRARRRRQGRDGRASTPSGRRPENLPSKAEIADPAAWVARVLGLRTVMSPAPRRRRRAPRRTADSGRPRARAPPSSWPARAAPTRWPCSRRPSSRAASAAWHVVGATVDHGLQPGSADARRPGRGADGGAGGRRDRDGPGRRRGRRARPGGGRPGGAVRRARRDRRALRGGRGAARPHPRRPGRDGAAGADPRLRRPVAGRDAPRLRALPPAAARRATRTTP